ncbi:TPA: hypothetical protein ACP2SZ_004412 [Escherichia coli]
MADHETEGFHVSDKGHPVTLQAYALTSNFANLQTTPGKQKAKAWMHRRRAAMTKKGITREQLEELRVKLKAMPVVNDAENAGKALDDRQVIADAIAQLKSRSYSLEQISEILKGNRMDLAPKPLRDYLNDL